ncbi:MAG TPA: ZIP family metal transporter [Oscillospiraceae bacterium]|nr:ZIP family metal transporter [Oscillospiraceae bacterium]
MVAYLSQFNIIWVGVLASLAAGLATGVGCLPIFFVKEVPKKVLDALLGAAAGVMLAATSFSLIIPAIEAGGQGIKGASIAIVGILAGGIFLDVVDTFFPNTNLQVGPVPETKKHSSKLLTMSPSLRRVWIFVLAITIHNFPEGMAVGVGFGDGQIANGLSLAIGIGLQNIPEGLAIALPLLREGFPHWKAFLVALATGLVEPIGGLIGIGLVQVARPLLPYTLAFAAGAMLFVIAYEIIPESQNNHGNSKLATHTLLIGFVVMMFLDVVLS